MLHKLLAQNIIFLPTWRAHSKSYLQYFISLWDTISSVAANVSVKSPVEVCGQCNICRNWWYCIPLQNYDATVHFWRCLMTLYTAFDWSVLSVLSLLVFAVKLVVLTFLAAFVNTVTDSHRVTQNEKNLPLYLTFSYFSCINATTVSFHPASNFLENKSQKLFEILMYLSRVWRSLVSEDEQKRREKL